MDTSHRPSNPAPAESGDRMPEVRPRTGDHHPALTLDPALSAGQVLTALIDALEEAVVVLDGDLRVLLANAPAETLLGAGDGHVEGAILTGLVKGREPAARLLEAVRQAAESGRPVSVKGLRWGERAYEVRVAPVSRGGKSGDSIPGARSQVGDSRSMLSPDFPDLLVLVAADVTSRERLEAELTRTARLVALAAALGGVAHEINNPLAGILGYAELLLAGDLSEAVRADLRRIYQEAERCRRVVQNLLFLARPRAQGQGPVDLHRLIEDTLSLLTYDLQSAGIRVRRDLAPGPATVHGDPHQLAQVFLNLLNNAQQAMKPQGGGTLTVVTRVAADAVRATISDTGPGIPAEVLPRLFTPFFSTKPAGEGTGLGLSLSRQVVEEHGGRITVESRPGRGAAFTVELPAGPEAPPPGRRPATGGNRS